MQKSSSIIWKQEASCNNFGVGFFDLQGFFLAFFALRKSDS
jgi:hypothetical protein